MQRRLCYRYSDSNYPPAEMKQSKVSLQPLDSKRSRLKPPPRPRPAPPTRLPPTPLVHAVTHSSANTERTPSRRVIRRTVSAGDGQDSERSRPKPPPRPALPTPLEHVPEHVLTHSSANAERTPSKRVIRRTVSAGVGDGHINSRPSHIRTSSRSRIAHPEQTNSLQRRELKGDAKNRLLRTQSTLSLSTLPAKPRRSPWPLSTSMTNLYTEPLRPPKLPPLRPPKPKFGTLQNAKTSNPETKCKPTRPPPPLLKVTPPIPLPDGECQSDRLLGYRDPEQPDDSDLAYCYVCVDARRELRYQCQSDFNSKIHSGKNSKLYRSSSSYSFFHAYDPDPVIMSQCMHYNISELHYIIITEVNGSAP